MSEEKTIEMEKKELDELMNNRDEKLLEKFQERLDAKFTEAEVSTDNKLKDLQVKDLGEGDPFGGWKTFSEFAKAVKRAELGQIDEKMNRWNSIIQKAAGDGVTVADPAQMGVLVPTGFLPGVFQVPVTDYSLRNRCSQKPLGGQRGADFFYLDGFDQSGGTVHGGIAWYNSRELDQYTETKPKAGKGRLYLNKVTGLYYASDEIERFSGVAVNPLVNKGFNDGLLFKIDGTIIDGSGAGEGLGILNSSCRVAVAKETNQVAATIVADNISKMWARRMPGNTANYIWLINPDVEPELDKLNFAVGTGGQLVYMPAGGMSDAPYGRIKGRPVIACDHCSTLGSEGDIMLVDLSVMLFADAGGVEAASSIHLKFDFGQNAYRFTYYYDHQPWMKTYFTPKNGNTRTPFVTLAARS